MKISFVGDIGLHNGYENGNYDKKGLRKYLTQFHNNDLIIGNLETFVRSNYRNPIKTPTLETSKTSYDILKGFNWLLGTANNHLFDTGLSGYNYSIEHLNQIGIETWGTSLKSDVKPFRKTINDTKISIFNYVHLDTGLKTPSECKINVPTYDRDKIIEAILLEKKTSDLVILYFHWGGSMDYGHFPDEYQINDSKNFIDAGADGIFGTHNHCIQPIDYYKSKPIVYGLGHFLFDDFYCNGTKTFLRPSGKKGISVDLIINKHKISQLNVNGFEIKNLVAQSSKKVLKKLKRINLFFKIYKRFKIIRTVYKLYLKKVEPKIFYYQLSDKSFGQKLKSISFSKIKQLFKS